jgi:predicted esterase
LDVSGDGAVDYNEMKKALNAMILEKSKKYAEKRKQEQKEANKKKAAEKAAAAAKAVPKSVALEIPAEEAAGELVVNAFSKHTHTVIMLHSFRGKAEMYARLYRRFGPLAAGFKFVFPRAPERTIIRAGEEAVVTGWYDPTKRYSADGSLQPVNSEQLGLQTKRLHGIIEREAALFGGDYSKIVLGGSHQGGTFAIHAAMTASKPVGLLICSRAVPLAPSITPVAKHGATSTRIFVFAAEKDTVYPVANVRQAFQQFSNAGYTVEWHTEPDLTHAADSPNEQRFVAYWVARECLGPEQGKILKGVIPVMAQKRAAEKAAAAKRQRAQSAGASPRSGATSPRGAAETGFVHALYREPDYRWLPQNGPSWDSSTAGGFMAPFSPIFADKDALLKRIDRGGPMLGREIRTPSPRGSRPSSARDTGTTQPDLLGDARYDLVTTAPRNPSISPPPSRPGTAFTARPAWNDDVSLKPGPGAGIFVSRPSSARVAKQSPRGALSPRARPKSAVNPLHMAVMAADAELAARPQSSPGLPRGPGPRTKRMNTRAPATVGAWTNDDAA